MTTTSIESMPLASALVRIGRERGVAVERLRADQLLRDAQAAWPGDPSKQWERWLRESAESLSLRCRIADLSPAAAKRLAAAGALLVQGNEQGEVVMLVSSEDGTVGVATGELDGVAALPSGTLGSDSDQPTRWIIVDHPQVNTPAAAAGLSHKPVRRLYKILRPEWADIWIVLVFAFFVGVLSLATPIAVESLVNTVAFGRLLQPVIVLATLLFGFLAFAGILNGMQIYVVELIQRRLFTRVAADLAYRLPRLDQSGLKGSYGPELVNRFLDVATLQKVVAGLLTDGISIILATFVGMTVLAFYHPWLLGFDVLLLIIVVTGVTVLGRGAIPAAIKESKMKYGLTAWFEDVVRCSSGFKAAGAPDYANDRASSITSQYLAYRRVHFRVLMRQIIFVLALQAVAGTILLGGGGWLVIQGQLSLGQLVAAELIVATILSSLAKLGKHIDGFYDVVAAVDKLGVLFDLPVERPDGVLNLPPGDGARVHLSGLKHPHGGKTLTSGLDTEIEAGERVAVYGPSGSGKTTLLRMLFGLIRPTSGHVEIEHTDPRDLRPDVLRELVGFAGEPEVFDGTINENIHLHRPGVNSAEVRSALFAVGLLDDVLRLPDGLETKINGSGEPFSMTQKRLLMIARAIACGPRLLLIDGLLDTLPDGDLDLVIDSLTEENRTWTLIVATGRSGVAEKLGRTLPLDAPPTNREGGAQ